MHPRTAIRNAMAYALAALKWLPAAALVGAAGGAVGVGFHLAIETATRFRLGHPWMLYFLPLGAIVIYLIYRLFRLPQDMGTNLILEAVRSDKQIPVKLSAAIVLGTVLTHLVGGSAGREGAALQVGGSLACGITRALRVRDLEDRHLLILCGMAAVFSALFGTPVTAVFFVLEVISVGRFFYSALPSCLTASFVAFGLARLLGGADLHVPLYLPEGVTAVTVLQTAVLAVLCALLSIVFCVVIHRAGKYSGRYLKNPVLRAFLLGSALLGLTLLSGGQAYNGAGFDTVERAVAGAGVDWYAFALKLLFTAITLAAGYRGGEIVPTFYVGAAFGAVAGPLLGLSSGFSAAVGMVSLFCGVVNCPVASLLLAVEVFGGDYLMLFALACALSYILSGYFGLYSSQHIIRSKVGAELIDRSAEE